jgi:ribosomal protein S12
MRQLAEQCRGVRSHGTTRLGRASVQQAVCTGIHEVASADPSGTPRRVAMLRLSNGQAATLRLPAGAPLPDTGAILSVRGGCGAGDHSSPGVTLAVELHRLTE